MTIPFLHPNTVTRGPAKGSLDVESDEILNEVGPNVQLRVSGDLLDGRLCVYFKEAVSIPSGYFHAGFKWQ